MARVRTHTNPLNFRDAIPAMDFKDCFPNYSGAIDLEIGFGRGVFLRHYAKRYSERCIVGVEVRKRMVEILRNRLENESIDNVRAVYGTGEAFLETIVKTPCLDRVFIFHPDPWFKKRHAKRRVVKAAFLDLLTAKMRPGGRLYVSTDVGALWDEMFEVISAYSGFDFVGDDLFWQEDYLTHWHLFSERDARSVCFGAWVWNPERRKAGA